MPLRLGRGEDNYEGLKLRSSSGPIVNASAIIAGGSSLQNKIYVWYVNGTTPALFEPDQSGLITALASAHDGSAVVIPSMRIGLTVPIAIKAGVTLIGLSRAGSVMSFTTLNNASAVTLGARSALEHLTIEVSGTQPLIGVDVRAAKARAARITVVMANHANNVCIYAGYAESAP